MEQPHAKSGCSDQKQGNHIEDVHSLKPQAELQFSEPVDLNDPRNWPSWKKDINLALMAFHALMTNFVGAGIIPVYTTFAEEFDVSVQQISYFTSIHILFTGLVPFFLVPFSNRYGRRPVWLVSTLLAAVFNIGCAKSSSYAAMMTCRVFCSIFLSAPFALGALVVVETYHEYERGIRMGIWAAMISLGPPLGPFVMGFVAQRVGWPWIYWTFAITSAVQFVLLSIFSPETLYVKGGAAAPTEEKRSSWQSQSFYFHRINPAPLTRAELYRPFELLTCLTVMIPIYAHSMVFNLVAGMLTVEIPQLFGPRFAFNAQQTGLQFIGIIVGTILAEIFNAVTLHGLRVRAAKRGSQPVQPQQYLLVSYGGFLCTIAGLVMFCLLFSKTTSPMQYSVWPIVGIGVAGFGNQVVATFLVNYVIQQQAEDASAASIVLGFVRQTCVETPDPVPERPRAAKQSTGGGSIAKPDGLSFSIDGETGYFAGSNAYWLPFLTNDADVDSVFDHLQQTGLKVLRTWGFNDVNTIPSAGTVYFQFHGQGNTTINTGANGLQRLDYVVSAAEKAGIKLIIPFVNNWDDYGGMDAYVTAYGGSKTGWYTNEKIQGVYQAYIKAVVSRYKDSEAIFAWELGNEPRCQGCDTDVIYNWATATSAFIKSLDPDHMVAVGDEGMGLTVGSDDSYPYSTDEGSDFAKNLDIPDIDFGTFHLYTTDWGITDNSWGNGWIESHAKACEAAGKPCVFEEYGMKGDHCTAEIEWQKTSLNTTGMGGDMFWQYGQTLSSGDSPDDQYTIYYGTDDWDCAVVDHVSQI
ncbi:hypothetical protein FE257_009646 [Aspergillus nanangensis]|uniref:mannan endo-1,4-beta-mannosidase n=1 Tax=Aspergillus nanangensis TaxID=2582783 RepID=A0AAD4CK46_ASPNN|nr:hypothetical protein FE257_009646 [Aspergillus nanangensis]